jgi:hypothetical protein
MLAPFAPEIRYVFQLTVDSILIFDAVGEEGLFRVSGNHEDLNNLKVDIDEGMFT